MNRIYGILLIVLMTSVFCQSGEVDISLKLKKGDSFRFSIVTNSNIMQEMNGQKNETTSKMTLITVQTVDSVFSNGDYQIAMYYDSLQNEIANSLIQNKQQDELSQILNKTIVGKKFYMRITPKWKVLDISGVDEMMHNMLDKIMENEQFKANAQVKPMMEEFFKKNLSKDNFTKMFQHISGAFPDAPVKVGSTWNHDIVIDVGIAPINMKNIYRLKKIEDGRLIIALESSVIKNEKAEPTKIGPVEMRLQMEGTQTGDIILDSKNCWMKEMALDQKMDGTMKMKVAKGDQIQEMNIPMEIKTKVLMATINGDDAVK